MRKFIKKIKNNFVESKLKRKERKKIKKQIKLESKNLKDYIRILENDKAELERNIRTLERQTRREVYSYLEPIRHIFTNINFNKKNQELSYIKTQLSGLLAEKNYEIYNPDLNAMHDKTSMIVDDVLKVKDKSKDGLIESVILCGIKQNGMVVLPARVRIYKGE